MSGTDRHRLFMVGINAFMTSLFAVAAGAVFIHEFVAGTWWRAIGLSSIFHLSVYNTVRAAIACERGMEGGRKKS
jgi:hypothetical protein